MKKALTIAVTLVVCAVAVSLASAAPRLDAGSTGLVQTPTAEVLGAGWYQVAVDYATGERYGDFKAYPARLVCGLGGKAELYVFSDFDTLGMLQIGMR